ncbi:lactate utilization protein, partial [Chloroflexota bacterium]
MSVFTDYKKEIMDAAHNDRIRMALSRAIASYRTNTNDALKKFPHTIEMAKEVIKIKEKAMGEMEKLAQQACAAIESNKGQGYIAKTAADALKIIGDLVGTD